MKIIVFGGSGLVGYHIAHSLSIDHSVISTYNNNQIIAKNCTPAKIDLLESESAENLISRVKPDLIVNTIGFPSVDKCETNPELTEKINVQGTKRIVDACKKFNTKIVYISTAFVFENDQKIYDESNEPNPINNYGKEKLECEKIIEYSDLPYLILRTDQIYGWGLKGQKQSFVSNVLSKLRNNEKIEVCRDWYNNPTHVKDIADCVNILIKKEKTGIYHLVGSSYVNRYEWGIKIARKFNYNEKLLVPINSSILDLPAKRPNCNLSNLKITQDVGFHMKKIDGGLDFMYKFRDDIHE